MMDGTFLREAIETAPYGFTLMSNVRDQTGKLVDLESIYQNVAAQRISHQTLTPGTRLLATYPECVENGSWAIYASIAEHGGSQTAEIAGPAGGDVPWFRSCVTRTPDGIALWLTDISAEKHPAEKLSHLDQRYRALVRATSDIIWTNSAEGEMRGPQPAWAAYTGQTFDEYQGYGWSAAIHPEDIADTIRLWQAAVAAKHLFECEHRVRAGDGLYRHFSVRAAPVLNEDGTIREWVGSHHNIHDRTIAEEQRVELLARQRSEARLQVEVNERKDAEARLRLRHHELREIIGRAPVGIAVRHGDAIVFCNATFAASLGYDDPATLIGIRPIDIVHPDERAHVEEWARRVERGAPLPTRTPFRVYRKDGSLAWLEMSEHIALEFEGAQAYLVIAFDVSERHEAELERNHLLTQVQESESKLAAVVENTIDAIYAVDVRLRLKMFNEVFRERFRALFGVEPVIGESITDRLADVSTRETFARLYDRALAGEVFTTELPMSIGTDEHIYSGYFQPIRRAGQITGVSVFSRDVTDTRISERLQRLRFAVTRVLADVTTFEDAVPKLLQAVGEHGKWELGNLWWLDWRSGEIRLEAHWAASPEGEGFFEDSEPYSFECGSGLPGQVWKTGTPCAVADITQAPYFRRGALAAQRHFHGTVAFPIIGSGGVNGVAEFFSSEKRLVGERVLSIMADIGSQVGQFFDRAAAESERDQFFALSLDVLGIANAEGYFKRVNRAFTETFGYTADEFTNRPFMDFVHPDDAIATLEEVDKLAQGLPVINFENRYRCKDGSYRWLSWKAASDVKTGLIYAAGRDVTARKLDEEERVRLRVVEQAGTALRQANDRLEESNALLIREVGERQRSEAQLRESEAQFRQVTELLPQIVWTARPDGWLDYYSQRWFDYTGLTLEQTEGWGWEPVLHPDDLQNCIDVWTHAVATGEAYQVEYRFKRASDGAYRWHVGRALPLRDASLHIVKWFGTCTDIDDYKSAEEGLRASHAALAQAQESLRFMNQTLEKRVADQTFEISRNEAQLRSVIEKAHDAFVTIDGAGHVAEWNPQAEATFGWSRTEVLGRPFGDVLLPARHRQAHVQALVDFLATGEGPLLRQRIETEAVRRDGRELPVELTMSAVQVDQTWRFNAFVRDLTAAKSAERKFRDLLESAPDAIVIFGDTRRIVLVNAQTENLFGYTREELLNQSVDILMPPRFREPGRTGYSYDPHARTIGMGLDLYGLRKDGTEFPVEISFSPIETEDGTLVSSAIRDVTGATKARDLLQSSLAEKEVLLKEIHHRVKNNLTLVSSLFYLESRYATDQRTLSILEESQRRVRSMALVHETLYQSRDLGEVDFSDYGRVLAAELLSAYQPRDGGVELKTNMQSTKMGIDTAVPCGLILNELISNAFKHAFPDGRRGTISIAILQTGDRTCLLEVADDGVGVAPDLDIDTHPSLGLRLIRSLVRQIHGSLSFERMEPGTTVRVKVNLHDDDN